MEISENPTEDLERIKKLLDSVDIPVLDYKGRPMDLPCRVAHLVGLYEGLKWSHDQDIAYFKARQNMASAASK